MTRLFIIDTPAGLVLVNKQPGVTSFRALDQVKHQYGKAVGHTGTLDKFARGLLVVLTGKLTKLVPVLTDMDKIYEAKIVFGKETDTLDPEGTVIAEADLPTLNNLETARNKFIGLINQVPPLYSAVHVDGKRAYERALSGQDFELTPRQVTISEFKWLDGDTHYARVRIHCSKGTYIRSLARDWALAAGTRGYVTELQRLQVGPFSLSEVIIKDSELGFCMLKPQEVFEKLKIPQVLIEDFHDVRQGKLLKPQANWPLPSKDQNCALFDPFGNLVALIRGDGDNWKYQFVCPL